MADTASRISLSIQEGTLEIVGSEDFVTKQLDRFEDFIKRSLDAPRPHRSHAPKADGKHPHASSESTPHESDHLTEYPNVFAFEDDKVVITADIPGKGMAARAVAAAQLLAFGYSLQGNSEVPAKDLIDLCTDHGCFDSPNFKRTLKAQKELFIIKGNGKDWTLKLSPRGKKATKELASQLNRLDEAA